MRNNRLDCGGVASCKVAWTTQMCLYVERALSESKITNLCAVRHAHHQHNNAIYNKIKMWMRREKKNVIRSKRASVYSGRRQISFGSECQARTKYYYYTRSASLYKRIEPVCFRVMCSVVTTKTKKYLHNVVRWWAERKTSIIFFLFFF